MVKDQVYCSRECAPYGYMVSPIRRKGNPVCGEEKASKIKKKYSNRMHTGIPEWLLKWRENRRIKQK